ncbi:DNA-formamidopyrimidine glycosylase [Bacillus alkalicellulosilyticus]|uniref:DNA-formamidopyrimidine glycosylase n=1 Tax=Alkalihalobacterium alkalicellulosilyticum TaxID=1912214 RepID=UPI0009978914|nr:DNA-formamidopyrimidine glycosylase [Bacillus alkalicellulosilyticus]
MPELPEMETYKRMLTTKVVGKPISNIIVTREKSLNIKSEFFQNTLQGNSFTQIDRRAKYLLFHLQTGQVLLLHLMLGGWMYFGREEESPDRTKQITLSFQQESLYFIGLRLGYLHLFDQRQIEEKLKDLGPDPLSLTAPDFMTLVKKRRGVLKTTLVNQQFVSGIGNFYSDEICFEAGLLPMRTADSLTDEEIAKLFNSMQRVLQLGIQNGGYMDHPFFHGDSLTGSFYQQANVYDREGEPCKRCGTTISKTILSSKKSFYCQNCQS